jgi:hypothetical protein
VDDSNDRISCHGVIHMSVSIARFGHLATGALALSSREVGLLGGFLDRGGIRHIIFSI